MKALKNKHGYTLVEMLAAFTLLIMFAASVALTVPSFIKTSMSINSMSLAQSVSDTLCNTVSSNLSAAADSASSARVSGSAYTPEVVISSGGKKVQYTDHYGYSVEMYVGADGETLKDGANNDKDVSGLLIMHYLGNNVDRYWFYGEETYMGCKISYINFGHLSENLIQYSIEITTDTGYVFTTYRTIECYNLINEAQISEQ